MKMPPARLVLVSVLPYLPSVTFLTLVAFRSMKYQQPIVVSNDSGKTRNRCSAKLDSEHGLPLNAVVLLSKRDFRPTHLNDIAVMPVASVGAKLISSMGYQ